MSRGVHQDVELTGARPTGVGPDGDHPDPVPGHLQLVGQRRLLEAEGADLLADGGEVGLALGPALGRIGPGRLRVRQGVLGPRQGGRPGVNHRLRTGRQGGEREDRSEGDHRHCGQAPDGGQGAGRVTTD